MAAPLATLTGMNHIIYLDHWNECTRESDGSLKNFVLGTEFLTIEPLATLTAINALEMDSEGRIVEVVLGAEFQTMTDEQAIIKLGVKTGAGSSHGKSVQATIRFVIQPVIFLIPFMTL